MEEEDTLAPCAPRYSTRCGGQSWAQRGPTSNPSRNVGCAACRGRVPTRTKRRCGRRVPMMGCALTRANAACCRMAATNTPESRVPVNDSAATARTPQPAGSASRSGTFHSVSSSAIAPGPLGARNVGRVSNVQPARSNPAAWLKRRQDRRKRQGVPTGPTASRGGRRLFRRQAHLDSQAGIVEAKRMRRR